MLEFLRPKWDSKAVGLLTLAQLQWWRLLLSTFSFSFVYRQNPRTCSASSTLPWTLLTFLFNFFEGF
jgi:hypothetical protein